MRLRWKPILGILCSLLLTLSLAIPPALVEAKRSSAPLRQVAVGSEGMVVTAHPLATQVGADVLRQGGERRGCGGGDSVCFKRGGADDVRDRRGRLHDGLRRQNPEGFHRQQPG